MNIIYIFVFGRSMRRAIADMVFLVLAILVAACASPTPTATPVPPTATPLPTPTPAPTATPQLTGAALVVKNFLDAQNASAKSYNIDATMAFFADNAVYTTGTGVKYTGDDIKSYIQYVANASRKWQLTRIQATGNKVSFQITVFVGNDPTPGAVGDMEAQVQGDKIIAWTELAWH